MTLREFKAWLEGYEESFGYSGPSSAQWAKIKERLETVEAWAGLKLPEGFRATLPKGGLVPSAQYLIGEHGAETISPLEAPQ